MVVRIHRGQLARPLRRRPCWRAIPGPPVLTLEDLGGSALAANDDVDASALDYCSRISLTLNPGTYYVAVSGGTAGRYRLAARAGS